MRTLIDTISDKRFTQNPNNINADDYEIVNITSIDTDDFFVFQKLYSKNEGSSGLEYYRLLLTPYDSDSVKDTPFVKVVDDLTNFLNLSKSEIHERHDYIDINNEDFIDFMNRAYFIKNPINIPDEYKKPLTVKKEDVFNNLPKKISGEVINPNFNYTIDLVNEDIFRDTKYIIEPAEVILHGENKIFDINNISYLKNNDMNLYNGNTHFNLTFHNYGINMQDNSFDNDNISYDKDLNTFTYKLSNPFILKMSDFKFLDKMLRRFPYVLNTAVEKIDNPNVYNIERKTSNGKYPNYSNSYYYTKYFDFSKTDYKIKTPRRDDTIDMNIYSKLTKENYDSSAMYKLFSRNFYQTELIPYHVSGNILSFDLQDDNKYLQLFISNIFPHNMLSNIEYTNMASTIYGVRIIDNVYNKYITPYNLNLNVSTHLPYADHYSRWHIQKVTNYTNNIYNNYRSMSLFNN